MSSGTGQHAEHFCREFKDQVAWQPTEFERGSFASILAYTSDLPNCATPQFLNAAEDWAFDTHTFDCMLNINMIHISPWACSEVQLSSNPVVQCLTRTAQGLFRGASRVLKPDGALFTYGPYKVDGKCTTESNQKFDDTLRERNPEWGIRCVYDERKRSFWEALGQWRRDCLKPSSARAASTPCRLFHVFGIAVHVDVQGYF